MGFLIRLLHLLILIICGVGLELVDFNLPLDTMVFKNIQEPSKLNVQHVEDVSLFNCTLPKFLSDTLNHEYVINQKFREDYTIEYEMYDSEFENDDRRSSLRRLRIINSKLEEFSEDAFSQYVNLEVIEFPYNNVKELGNNLFSELKNLNFINASHNNIRYLNENVFPNNNQNLVIDLSYNNISNMSLVNVFHTTRLDLSYNAIQLLKNDSLQPDLEYLNLEGNLISELEANFLEKFKRLWCLILSNNKLRILNGIFLKNENLSLLHLENNSITYVNAMAFLKLPSLETLVLSNNKIALIREYSFTGLNNLKQLFLDQNFIESIEENSFVDLNLLEKLDLSSNKLKWINVTIPKGLKEIELSKNPLIILNSNYFHNLFSLTLLDLSHLEKYYTIRNSSFKNLKNLEILNLKSNRINLIEPNSFSNLSNLKFFDLSFNKLRVLTSEFSLGLKNITQLNFEGNSIEILESNCFQDLISLSVLDLSKQNIKILENSTFNGLKKLTELNLKGNDITQIQNDTFNLLKTLKSLDLSFNKIKYLNSNIFKGQENLLTLFLNDNKINNLNPSCFFHLESLTTLNLSKNAIQKLNIGVFVGLISLKHLDLSFNQIRQINPIIFHDPYSLNSLYLNDNKIQNLNITEIILRTNLSKLNIENNDLFCNVLSNILLKCIELNVNVVTNFNKIEDENLHSIKCVNAVNQENTKIADEEKIYNEVYKLFHILNKIYFMIICLLIIFVIIVIFLLFNYYKFNIKNNQRRCNILMYDL